MHSGAHKKNCWYDTWQALSKFSRMYWYRSWLAGLVKSTVLQRRSLERSMSWGADFVQAIVRAPTSASGMALYA